jgi:glutamate racemase
MNTTLIKNQLGSNAIGIFDSGIGGLSVLKSFQAINPGFPVIYFADQAHVPYGPRTIEEIKDFSFAISEFLIDLGANIIVVACNTASAAALHPLRNKFPEIQFVGMEPAVKPAAENSHSGVVGVLATPATFQGKLYVSVVERFAKGVIIYQNTCPGLVQEIEAGKFAGADTQSILENALIPMLRDGIDTVVLGCTHYSFVIPTIQAITNDKVRVIDPAPAVARQTLKIALNLMQQSPLLAKQEITLITSGQHDQFLRIVQALNIPHSQVLTAEWAKNLLNLNLTQHSK